MPDYPRPKKAPNPHDRFFRGAMSDPEVAWSFIQQHLPAELLAQVDPGSLKLTRGTFIDEALREYITDVIYQASFSGDLGYLYFLAEHQRKSEPLMPLRLLEYMLQICRMHLREHGGHQLPLVYPCVIYNGKKPYHHTSDFFELFKNPVLAREIFFKPFQLIDLTQVSDDTLKKQSLIGIVEILLKHAFARDIISLVQETMAEVMESLATSNKLELFTLSTQYLLQTQQGLLSKNDVVALFQPYLSPTTQIKMMTIAESLMEEGRQEGIQTGIATGIATGREEGYRMLLLKQIDRRFPGKMTDRYRYFIEEADSETLALWIERLMDNNCIEAIFTPRDFS